MFIQVKLLNGLQKPLTYKIPKDWPTANLEGAIIKVPLQQRHEFAYVEKVLPILTAPVTYEIREAETNGIIPSDPYYLPFLQKLSAYYALDKIVFLKRLKSFLKQKEHAAQVSEEEASRGQVATLTDEQQHIVDTITPQITKGVYYPSVIHGVTGSGKTEIYKKLIEHAWQEDKGALLLFPEVSLAVRFAHLLRKQLPSSIKLFSFHSATSIKEKRLLWHHLMTDKPAVILGVHLPMLLPLPKLGLIILDEEHDSGYQEKKHPRVNTKEAAFLRAQCSSIPIVAGSATPSISSLYNVTHKGWELFELKKRFSGAFPTIKVVKLTQDKTRTHFFMSNELKEALTEQLKKNEQTILFLNRRGYSFFIQCKSCGHVPHCENCAVSLTLHKTGTLLCHYCSYSIPVLTACPACKKEKFLKKGIGTQQVVTILEKLFPQARVARADLDTTVNKKTWTETMEAFEAGTIDILVGTQTITKGYHFPKVTLVGILWADLNLSIPMYNAAETTLQQLIQVAGRAGRQSPDSRVIVQTMISHPIFDHIDEQNYRLFYDQELKNRQKVVYPPCVRFAEIEVKHTSQEQVEKDAYAVAQHLRAAALKMGKKLTILGPSEPPVAKIKKVHARKIYLKAESIGTIIDVFNRIKTDYYKASIFFTPNPLS